MAHAAIADPARGALLHDQRIARTGFGAASASIDDTDVRLDRWRLTRSASGGVGVYGSRIAARSFTLDFDARPTQPLLLQGEAGYSRKGPRPEQASYYYSQPQLAVRARVTRDGRTEQRTGVGWLDHEWSSSVLDEAAAGWDWIGMNLDDGGALTAFVIRRRLPIADPASLHAYGALRRASGEVRTYGSSDVGFATLQTWTSPRTNAAWPVAREIRIGERTFTTQPLMNDQELDSRPSTGAVYWEGASRLLESGKQIGRGYLEMTGYATPMRL